MLCTMVFSCCTCCQLPDRLLNAFHCQKAQASLASRVSSQVCQSVASEVQSGLDLRLELAGHRAGCHQVSSMPQKGSKNCSLHLHSIHVRIQPQILIGLGSWPCHGSGLLSYCPQPAGHKIPVSRLPVVCLCTSVGDSSTVDLQKPQCIALLVSIAFIASPHLPQPMLEACGALGRR